MGEMTGGMKIAKVLYLKGFLAIDGRDGGFFDENYYFLKNQKPFFIKNRIPKISQPSFKQFPAWEQSVPTVGTPTL